jgi:hypothetical protein
LIASATYTFFLLDDLPKMRKNFPFLAYVDLVREKFTHFWMTITFPRTKYRKIWSHLDNLKQWHTNCSDVCCRETQSLFAMSIGTSELNQLKCERRFHIDFYCLNCLKILRKTTKLLGITTGLLEEKNEKAQFLDDYGLCATPVPDIFITDFWSGQRRLFVCFPHILLWPACIDDVGPSWRTRPPKPREGARR